MNTNYKTMKAVCYALVFAVASSAGTVHAWSMPKMFSLDNTWPFRDKDKPQQGIPTRMVGTWTDTVMTQGGQKPQRGFGGRVIFYDKEGKKPILVEGQLVVYAFDETNREMTDNKPTRRYVFPADQIPIHMSKCDMGASYSFWLPWDEAGGPQTTVSLICRFEPKGGAVVTGESSKVKLPGTIAPPSATAGAPKPPKVPEGVSSKPPRQTLEDIRSKQIADQQARQTSFEAPAAPGQPGVAQNGALPIGTAADRHLSASTITLPQNYQLPDTAALNAAMQQAGYQPPARPMPLNAAQMQMQQQAAPMMNQQMGAAQPYMGSQLPPQPQYSPAAVPSQYPGVQAYATVPVQSNQAYGQIQQQSYQQPLIQGPMTQPPPIRPQQATMPTWTQTPSQAGQTATVNSPATALYR